MGPVKMGGFRPTPTRVDITDMLIGFCSRNGMFAMTVRSEDDARGLALVLNVQRMLHVHGNETQRERWIHRLGALPTVRSGVARYSAISHFFIRI